MRFVSKTLHLLSLVLASGVGTASLLLLVTFLYLGNLRSFSLGLSPVEALGLDGLLSAAFFAQHSGMVRRPFQRWLGSFVPGAFHGLVYTTASGSVLILCLVLWQSVGEPLLLLEGVSALLLRAVFVLAIAGFGWGLRALGPVDTFGVEPVVALFRGGEPRSHPFVIRGPYRWVRHPLYFFAILLFWSCPTVTSDRLLFNLLWTAWVVLATMLEERDLVSRFGSSYIQYQRKVPMLLPWRIPNRRASES